MNKKTSQKPVRHGISKVNRTHLCLLANDMVHRSSVQDDSLDFSIEKIERQPKKPQTECDEYLSLPYAGAVYITFLRGENIT